MFIWVLAVYEQRAFPCAQAKYAQSMRNQNRITSKQQQQQQQQKNYEDLFFFYLSLAFIVIMRQRGRTQYRTQVLTVRKLLSLCQQIVSAFSGIKRNKTVQLSKNSLISGLVA